MVRAAAGMAEAELARHLVSHRVSEAPRPRSGLSIKLEALGRHESLLTIDDGRTHRSTLRLTPRHSEIAVAAGVGAPWPLRGRTGSAFVRRGQHGLYLRAELSRLRTLLGDDLLGSRPYRLVAEVTADWLAVEAHRLAATSLPPCAPTEGRCFTLGGAGCHQAPHRRGAVLPAGGHAARRPRLDVVVDPLGLGRRRLRIVGSPARAAVNSVPATPLISGQIARLDRELGI